MIKQNMLLVLMLVLLVGCSNQPTNDGMISLEEYDEGLNLKVIPSTALASYLITFNVPVAGDYGLIMMNATGYTVKTWSGPIEAGVHNINWNLINDNNKKVKNGIYIFELDFGSSSSREVLVIREDQ